MVDENVSLVRCNKDARCRLRRRRRSRRWGGLLLVYIQSSTAFKYRPFLNEFSFLH